MNPIARKASLRLPPVTPDRRTALPLFALAACALLAGCGDRGIAEGGGAGDDLPSLDGGSCELDDQLAWVERNMRSYYLFYDQVPVVRRSDYGSPEELLEALKVPPDTFSFITDANRSAALFDEGERVGYGWHIEPLPDRTVLLTLIDAGSPLDVAGVRRGEILVSVNGLDIRTITNDQIVSELGTGDDVLTADLGIQAADGSLRVVAVTRSLYSVLGVQQLDILERDGLNIGYMNFLTFVEPARAELDTAFATLKAARVDELVLDLRFNGGGRVDVANELASRIGGAGVQGRDFTRFRFNDQAAGVPTEGIPLPFVELVDSLDLGRVYVLTGPGTCSASEMVVNGLSPFVDVVSIGESTCGKPYGFRGVERCGQAMFAVEFEFVNDSGVGGYVEGLAPDCNVQADGRTPLGTVAEPLFSAAVQHIDSATCPAMVANADPAQTRSRQEGTGTRQRNPVNPFDDELLLR